MIKLFEDIFGPGFWANVIFAVSRCDDTFASKFLENYKNGQLLLRWHFGKAHVDLRTQTEEEWTDDMNKEFSQLSHKVGSKKSYCHFAAPRI